MLKKIYSFDKIKVILIAAIVIMFGLLTKQCNNTVLTKENGFVDSLKTIIKDQKSIADSLKKKASSHDSVRLEYITKWRTKVKILMQYDSIPCDSVLPLVISTCDTIILRDSIYILDLKNIVFTDSIIMDSQDQVIKLYSIKIADLERKVVRLKKHRRWLLFGTSILGGAILLNSKP